MATFRETNTGDLDISTGRLVVTTDVATEYKQKMDARLNLWRGEWYQNKDVGVPGFERILVPNPNMADVQSVLRTVIVSVPGTVSVLFSSFDLNKTTRKLAVKFQTYTDFSNGPLDFNWSFVLPGE